RLAGTVMGRRGTPEEVAKSLTAGRKAATRIWRRWGTGRLAGPCGRARIPRFVARQPAGAAPARPRAGKRPRRRCTRRPAPALVPSPPHHPPPVFSIVVAL